MSSGTPFRNRHTYQSAPAVGTEAKTRYYYNIACACKCVCDKYVYDMCMCDNRVIYRGGYISYTIPI